MLLEDANEIFLGGTSVNEIYLGTTLVWPKGAVKKYRLVRFNTYIESHSNVVLVNTTNHRIMAQPSNNVFSAVTTYTVNSDGTVNLPSNAAKFTTGYGLFYNENRIYATQAGGTQYRLTTAITSQEIEMTDIGGVVGFWYGNPETPVGFYYYSEYEGSEAKLVPQSGNYLYLAYLEEV